MRFSMSTAFLYCLAVVLGTAAGWETSNMTIHIYGGSITQMGSDANGVVGGADAFRYSAVLADLLPNASVHNFGIGGTGVGPHIACGLSAAADVIVSEYRINEHSVAQLVEFYNLAKNFAPHIIILDLWSWYEPWKPVEKMSATRRALLQIEGASAGAGAQFSVLDLATLTGPMWAKQIPPFTADTMFSAVAKRHPGPQARRCLLGATEATAEDRAALHYCRGNFRNEMQHGTEQYHAFVGAALARSINELDRNNNQQL